MSDKKTTIENGKYEVVGYFGCWCRSFENKVNTGDVRFIGGKLMYAYSVYKKIFKANEINWCAIQIGNTRFGMEDIRNWIQSL